MHVTMAAQYLRRAHEVGRARSHRGALRKARNFVGRIIFGACLRLCSSCKLIGGSRSPESWTKPTVLGGIDNSRGKYPPSRPGPNGVFAETRPVRSADRPP